MASLEVSSKEITGAMHQETKFGKIYKSYSEKILGENWGRCNFLKT